MGTASGGGGVEVFAANVDFEGEEGEGAPILFCNSATTRCMASNMQMNEASAAPRASACSSSSMYGRSSGCNCCWAALGVSEEEEEEADDEAPSVEAASLVTRVAS